MEQSRQLAAIMFTDIVGYTTLMGSDSAKALKLVHVSKEIQKPLVEKHRGQWLKEMGDGALAKFDSALDAVLCAVEIQKTARADFDGKLRIGIHLGDVTFENDDVFGDGVNVAARLESIADPGGIFISDAIEKAIRGQTDIQAKYIGESHLKNVDYQVRTYAVQGVGLPVPVMKEEQEISGHFIAELQRRGVFRTSMAYLIVALFLTLLSREASHWFNLSVQFTEVVMILMFIGFPISIFLSWNYERSPKGFIRTTTKSSWQNPFSARERKPLTGPIILVGLTVASLVMIFLPRFRGTDHSKTAIESEATIGSEAATIISEKTIAVLPFKNDSPDADNQYFADGMMDEILNHLFKISELGVKSRTAVEPYRDSTLGLAVIAGELKVAFVLEGAVRRYGDRFRLTTQLIEVASGNHLWSETYDGVFSDTIFIVQANIAKEIASSLNTVITPDEENSIDRVPTANIEAYDLYVRASYEQQLYWSTFDKQHLKTAHGLLDKALKIDPKYLIAMVSKGHAFIAENNLDSAIVYADRAIDLDPDFNRGYGLKGAYYLGLEKNDLAIEYYLKAINLPPKDARWHWYHAALGRGYLRLNEVIKALPYLQKGFEGDEEEDRAGTYFWIWAAYTNIGDYEKAEVYGRKAAEFGCIGISPVPVLLIVQGKFREAFQFTDSTCHQKQCERACFMLLFRTSYLLGEFEKAEQYFNQWRNTGPDFGFTESLLNHEIGYVYYQLGNTEEAEKIFTEQIKSLESELDSDFTSAEIYLARIYAFLGEKSKALNYLASFSKKRGFRGLTRGWHDFILIDPFFESLRDDPEFKTIVKQAQEEKAALRAQVREMEERGELDL